MGLTERKRKILRQGGYVKLYEKHKSAWLKYAQGAYVYARDFIAEGGEPGEDDIVHPLLLVLEANETLLEHQALETPKIDEAEQQERREYFAAYVVHQYLQSKGARP
ncbi:MAG: hypothetical protein WA175_03170 [Candidatus Acidiferrales bacterium]